MHAAPGATQLWSNPAPQTMLRSSHVCLLTRTAQAQPQQACKTTTPWHKSFKQCRWCNAASTEGQKDELLDLRLCLRLSDFARASRF